MLVACPWTAALKDELWRVRRQVEIVAEPNLLIIPGQPLSRAERVELKDSASKQPDLNHGVAASGELTTDARYDAGLKLKFRRNRCAE